MKKPILLIPLITLAFIYQMAILGKVPLPSDTVSIKPIASWIEDTKESEDGVAFWYPYVFGGMPSYGSYINTAGNPFAAIFNFILVNRGLKYWFYFSAGGLGLFLLLRRRKIAVLSALFGGLVYALSPYLFGLIGAGHATKIMSLGYFPWIFLAADYAISSGKWRSIIFIALASAMQLWANHPQMVYYTWMIIIFLWIWNQAKALISKSWTVKSEGKSTLLIFGGLFLALLLVTDPYVTVYEFQGHSNRGGASVLDESGETESGTSWDYATQWSFEPYETISFLYPYFYGLQNFPTRDINSAAYWGGMPFTQSTHYFGILVVLLAILGALLKKPDNFQVFLWVSSGLILLLGFGQYFPVLFGPLFYLAPFFAKFRVPSMIYSLLPFTFAILASIGFNNILGLMKSVESDGKAIKRIIGVFGGFLGLTFIYLLFGNSLISFLKPDETSKYAPQVISQIVAERQALFQKGILIALFVSGGGFAAVWLGVKKKISPAIAGIIIVGLTVIELWIVDRDFLYLKTPQQMEQQFQPNAITDFLTKDDGLFRIFPADELNTNWYGYFNLASIGGYRPVKLRTYQDLMDAGGLNNLQVLNMLNVKYLITKKSITHPSLELVFDAGTKVFRNRGVLPKAWLVDKIVNVNSQKESLSGTLAGSFVPSDEAIVINYDGPELQEGSGGRVEVARYSENQINLAVKSGSDALLVLSENYYGPGWRAFINGTETKIYQTNHVLRSVAVPAGESEVRFEYDSRKWLMTRLISRVALFLSFAFLIFIYRNKLMGLVAIKK